jgi:transcriptional regulator of arginine metabolism
MNNYLYFINNLIKRIPLKERHSRLKAIRKLIKNHRVESQETLLSYLQKEGYEVTQATLSRDLKMLKVGKVSDGNAGYFYTLPSDEENQESEQIYKRDFLRGYVSIDWSGNIIVIKTFPGHANTVSNALDNLNLEDLLGTVAGDNCLFACIKEGVSGEDFVKKLKAKIPEIEY